MSATLLGFYDSFKKKSLKDNAVIPVLFINTVICSLGPQIGRASCRERV